MNVETYVLHVKKGYEDRAKNISQMLSNAGISFSFITDGDMPDITEDILDKYFVGKMHQVSPVSSCALKHILACEQVVSKGLDGALLFEDDMILYDNFNEVYAQCIEELAQRGINNALVSFEDSSLHFVPRSQRKKGIHLYRAKRDRFTGCLFITKQCAQMILDYIAEHKCHIAIDCFHRYLIKEIGLPYYWCHPAITTQGTHNGLYMSSINEKSARKQTYRKLTWKLKLAYKKIIYWFR